MRCDFLPEVWQPDEATRRLRELTGRRSALVGQRTAMRNRIHSVLAMRLVDAPARLFNAEGRDWLAEVELDEQGRLLVDSDLRQLEFLQKEIDTLDAELARRGHASDDVKLLMTLPGVDVTTAEAMLAAWGDVHRFPDGDHAASYLGLVPSTKQSANLCYHGPITKRGNSQARWMLIEAAQHLDKNPGPLGHFFRRLLKKKNRNVAVVAAARKLAAIGWLMLKHNEPYRYAIPREHGSEAGQVAREGHGPTAQQRRAQGDQVQAAKLPGGSRTVKSLPAVCRWKACPPHSPFRPANNEPSALPAAASSWPQLAARAPRPAQYGFLFSGPGESSCLTITLCSPSITRPLAFRERGKGRCCLQTTDALPTSPKPADRHRAQAFARSYGRAGGRVPSPCTPYPHPYSGAEPHKKPHRQLTRTEVDVVLGKRLSHSHRADAGNGNVVAAGSTHGNIAGD